ncbi:ABC-2 family transporter protein [bacterium BMS3Bbin14]|nr:ABC-2 family transporter protein [bacterium BMS3Abin13]GBE53715.1 ABC-2 family transporter protein [bacterium BMS3Bbin14]HDK43462.1 ABC transporter permease [Desulfobacteraceae bacterium]HDL98086.1 ABC transporter permease [Desulfobacteraceae bacterium]HDO29858.1 ABC transporter permease [Desulfobacteraceae bacterium]
MMKIFTAAAKELLLLQRDRAGLLVLFIMPAILVVVITLVQENVMELTGQKTTRVLFLDQDKGELGVSLQKYLANGHLEIVAWDKKQKDIAAMRAAVTNGDYQVGIVVPAGSSARFHRETARLLQKNARREKGSSGALIPVRVFFDPGIMPGLRSGITAQLQMALQTIAMEAKIEALERMLKGLMARLGVPPEFTPLPGPGLSRRLGQPLLTLENSQVSSRPTGTSPYNPVQQNVPAWALFGMFFTAIPIAGAILQERKSGIWIRLTSLPVSPLLLFTGKILAYIGVCLCQFLLIGLIGSFLFPHIGLPAFTVSRNPAGVLLIVLFSSLAACGYGIFLGMICSTYEQASTLGATTVVAAAAIGGVMVPVYAMPRVMQRLSTISPLNWGLTAFHDLLMRGNALPAILDDLGRLAIFFLLTILLSWKLAQIRR